MKRILVGVVTLFFVGFGAASTYAAEVTFAAYTNGAFDAAAVPNTSSAQSATLTGDLAGDLVYNNASFSGTSSGGSLLGVNLGSFTLAPSGNPDFDGHTFTLRVTFTIPTGINSPPGPSSTYSALLTGEASSAPGQCPASDPAPCGSVTIDFDNTPVAFTFANSGAVGSFKFNALDLTVLAGQTAILRGNITDASQREIENGEGDLTPAPEPTSMLLLGSGLAAAAARARRRKAL